jgi:hypothetical protein
MEIAANRDARGVREEIWRLCRRDACEIGAGSGDLFSYTRMEAEVSFPFRRNVVTVRISGMEVRW